jgi:hypothetical protein
MIIRLDLDELERELGEEVNDFLVDLANEIVNQMKQEAPVGATGDLQRSIQIFRTGDGEVWLGTRIHYAMDVWKGTEPHLADFDAIQVWARRKLGNEAAAGPVWRHIAQEGTAPNDFVGRAIDQAIDRVA